MPTLEEVGRDWDLKIAKASDEEKPGLELQKRDAIIAFQGQQAAERDRADWRAEALKLHPRAAALADYVSGDTKEAIIASAKAIEEQFNTTLEAERQKAIDEAAQTVAGRVYGNSGGIPPGANRPNADEAEEAYFQKAMSRLRTQLSKPPVSGPVFRWDGGGGVQPGDPIDAPKEALMGPQEATAYIRWRLRKRLGLHVQDRSRIWRSMASERLQGQAPPALPTQGGDQ
jgi:hypothetical protein